MPIDAMLIFGLQCYFKLEEARSHIYDQPILQEYFPINWCWSRNV